MEIGITAIGTALPEYTRTQKETAELITDSFQLSPAEKRLIKSVYKATGIERRYSVLKDYAKKSGEFEFFPNEPNQAFPSTAKRMQIYRNEAIKLVLTAIDRCLANANCEQRSITHVITVSCTGMYAPGIDIEIVHHLKLHPSTKRTAINFMGCYGAFNAIKVADAICKSDSHAVVLIASVELCTIHFQQKMSMDNIIANAIFSDGAAAVLMQANPNSARYLSIQNFHCDILPQSNDMMAWEIADQGFDIVLSSYVPEVVESGVAKFTQYLFEKANLNISDIDFYAIHPGGIKILQACEQALEITEEDNRYAYHVLKNYGNMSSATILFVLNTIFDDVNISHHQQNMFSCAFGPGLTLESMFLKIHCLN